MARLRLTPSAATMDRRAAVCIHFMWVLPSLSLLASGGAGFTEAPPGRSDHSCPGFVASPHVVFCWTELVPQKVVKQPRGVADTEKISQTVPGRSVQVCRHQVGEQPAARC